MSIRISKLALVAALAFYLALVVFNNLTDYGSNYQFIAHVLSMDNTFPGNAGMWRAITSPTVYRLFYGAIILWETAACLLLATGAWRLWWARGESSDVFQAAKSLSLVGLTLTMVLWLVAFLSVGGEWFLMWQSRTWNGSETAGRMCTMFGLVWIVVAMRDDEVPRVRL